MRRLTRWCLAGATALAIAAGGTLAPSAAFAVAQAPWYDAQGNYHQVLFDGNIRNLPSDKRIDGVCPQDRPYLHGGVGTAARDVGQGFMVRDDSWGLFIQEDKLQRRYGALPGGGRAVTATDLVVKSYLNPDTGLYVEMVCTASVKDAWRA